MTMQTVNRSHPLNTLPFVSEEIERMLRLRAWKDEIFREALIADPKGVIQRLFPQCFPNGKLPEELTIKVIEEDPGTCHIVLPSLPEEFPTPEIPEEEHLEFVANMGVANGGRLERRDSSDNQGQSQLSEKTKPRDLLKDSCKRQQTEGNKENIPVPGDHHDSRAKLPTRKELEQAFFELSQNKEHHQELQKLFQKDPNQAIRTLFQEYLPGHQLPQGVDVKVLQDKPDTHHLVLPSSPDASRDTGVPEPQKLDGCCVTCCVRSSYDK
jgi:hypothetical protein